LTYYKSIIPLAMLPFYSSGVLLTYGQLNGLNRKYGKVTISNAVLGVRLHCHARTVERYLSKLSNGGVIQVITKTENNKTKRHILVRPIEGKFIIVPDWIMAKDRAALSNGAKLIYGLLDRQVRVQIKVFNDNYNSGVVANIDGKEVWEEAPEYVTTSEAELARTIGATPRTVRRALNQLLQQGAILDIDTLEGVGIKVQLDGTNYDIGY
jgi:hypothetical protein